MKKEIKKDILIPWTELGNVLLNCVFEALTVVVDKYNNNQELRSNDDELREKFKPFITHKENIKRGYNSHFKIGWYQKPNNYESRLVKIVIKSFEDTQEWGKGREKKLEDDPKNNGKGGRGYYLPSPLFIVYQILTIPDEAQSSAYSLLFTRSLLYETYEVIPKTIFPIDYYQFNILELKSSLSTFYSYIKKDENIPKVNSDHVQLMLAQFLAMKGIFYYRFGTVGKKKVADDRDVTELVHEYLLSKSIDGSEKENQLFEFRLCPYFEDLPSADALMNDLAGIPIPFRGAGTVFQGGIKTNMNSNLVMRISGEPGTGKTSFALALAALMSPMGTLTYYITFEEEEEDLMNRLFSVIPNYLKRLSIYREDVKEWFIPEKVELPKDQKVDWFLNEYINRISKITEEKKANFKSGSLPAICPLIVVIDSIRVLVSENREAFEKFVAHCKKLNAILILISANKEEDHSEIDYTVDLVIHLRHEGTEKQSSKPIRILQLTKTRHQISRPGAHVFHLSGEKGLRISPQLPSQIDKKEKLLKPESSKEYYINFFNEVYALDEKQKNISLKRVSEAKKQLRIWNKSQILLHGFGSSGKAALALGILLTPPKHNDENVLVNYSLEKYRSKILIVSLLYPEEYYTELKTKLSNSIGSNYNIKDYNPKIKTIYFYSGYLPPEDFISRILRHLDAAILEGEPYTGILLDGLHNVSLQFHNLQDSDMVWPTLYSLLVKYRLTVISTFTNFIIDKVNKELNRIDDEILLKGQLPLLHSLVESNDYYFTVQPPTEVEKNKGYKGKYIVYLKSAIRHEMNDEKYVWDREKKRLFDYASVSNDPTLFDHLSE